MEIVRHPGVNQRGGRVPFRVEREQLARQVHKKTEKGGKVVIENAIHRKRVLLEY